MTCIPIIKYFIASKSSEDGRDGSVRVRASLSWQKIIYRREHAAAATAFTERPTWVLHSTPTRQPSPNSIPPYHAHAINTFKTIKNLVLKHTFDLLTTIACYVHSPLLPYQRSPLLEITPTSTGVFPTPENGHYANSPHTLHADSYSNLPYLLFYIQCKASSCIPIIIINAITFNPVLVLTQTRNHVSERYISLGHRESIQRPQPYVSPSHSSGHNISLARLTCTCLVLPCAFIQFDNFVAFS